MVDRSREKPGRGDLVMGRDDGVIENDSHGNLLQRLPKDSARRGAGTGRQAEAPYCCDDEPIRAGSAGWSISGFSSGSSTFKSCTARALEKWKLAASVPGT